MFNLDPATLFLSIVVSAIGYAYFRYGKKGSPYFRIFGIALMIYPYFIADLTLMIGVGIVLLVAPFILKRVYPL